MTGFVRATKRQSKARIALDGPSGSGKTWTALATATALAGGGRIALIDSERGSASKYADDFDFDVLELDGDFHPDRYIEGLKEAVKAGYGVAVLDSLTHAWAGKNGVLEQVDAAKARFGGNSQRAWAVGTPMWQSLIDAMLQSPIHVIATMRSKVKYVEVDKGGGRKGYEKMGMEPVAREGIDYEFDVVGDLDLEHNLVVSKSRAGRRLEAIYRRPGSEFGDAVLAWLSDGAVDTKELARQLGETAGDVAALKAALKAEQIGMDDLADEKTLAKARKIAAKVAQGQPGEPAGSSPPAPTPTRRESDDPTETPPPDGQVTLGSGL